MLTDLEDTRTAGIRRSRCTRATFVAVVAATVAIAACGGSTAKEPLKSSVSEVRDMLRVRARRLLDHDVAGYLAPMSPEARAAEEGIAKGAVSVPLSSIDLVFTPSRRVSANAPEFLRERVQFTYKYRDIPPDNDFVFDLKVDIQKRDGAWMVTRSAIDGEAPLWSTGGVEVTRSAHFLAMYRSGLAGVDRALAVAEQARERLRPRVTVRIDEVHVMVLARNAEELESLSGSFPGEGTPLAFAESYGRTGGLPGNRQIVVDTEAVLSRDTATSEDGRDVSTLVVFQHELAHLVLSRYNSGSLPGWVAEGAAMYLADERRLGAWRDPEFRRLLDEQGVSFAQLDILDDVPGSLYPYANAGVYYLFDKVGPEAFWNFYRSFRDLAAAPRPSPSATARAMEKFIGMTEKELDARTREYIDAAIRTT